MEDIEVLTDDLRARSLSHNEIVLPYADALHALRILEEAHWAVLGWEPWIKVSNGKHVHPLMGNSWGKETGENWKTYVQRSVSLCQYDLWEAHSLWQKGRLPLSAQVVNLLKRSVCPQKFTFVLQQLRKRILKILSYPPRRCIWH